ncbi:MAG TPA: PAS domain S-box protein [Microvirga sp.]|nr:PAS domain S-box protein [Microvirga sp.]
MKHRLFLFAVAALVPLIALAAGLTLYSLNQQQTALRDEATHHVSGIIDAVERELFNQTEVLRGLATSLSLDQASLDLQRFHAQASRFVEELRHWDVIVLADLEGRQVVNTRFSFGAPLPAVFDDWSYRRVIEAREPVIGNVSGPGPIAADRTPVVNIRVPVLRNGSLRYVLTASINARPLSAMIGREIDPRWRAFLIDGAGRIAAAAPRLEAIGQRPSEQTLAARAATKQGLYEGLTLDGLRTVTAFQMSDRMGWSAHVSIPEDLYNAPLVRSLWFLGASVLAALAVTLLFVEFLRREALSRERALDQLQAAEQRFRDFAELGSDWFWETDANFRITEVAGQPTAVPVIGKTRWEAAGGDPDSLEWKDHIALVHSHEPFHQFRYKAVLNGQTFYLETSGRPLLNTAGQFLGYRGVTTNVTVRRGAELAAAEQSALLQATLDNMDQGLIMIDGSGIVQVCNRRAVEMLDLPEHYTHSKPSFSDFLAHQVAIGEFTGFTEERVSWLKLKNNLLSAPPVYERTRPNGTHLEVRTVHLPDGTAVRTFTDTTARKRAEAEQKDSEGRYRLLADNSTDMIGRTNLDGVRLYLSPASRELLGYEPEELVGSRLGDITHPEDRALATSSIADLLSSRDGRQTITYRMQHSDGRWVLLESRRRLVRDERGNPTEFISVARDVTEQRRLEEQLRQSQKMEAVGQLTGGIAHDFNNLLTVVLGNAEILTEDPSDPALTFNLARQILETAQRGADLNQKLLTFGRRQSMKPERLKIERVVENMVPLLYRAVGEHIDIETRCPETHLSMIVDRSLLESALLNLAVNARDAMPQGGTLTITTGDRVAGPGEGSLPIGQEVVFVTVSDTGTGMTPDILSRVFEPFFTTKEVGKGSGLGLSMVFGFAEQSAGHVSITSKPREGTAVTIVLPAFAGGSAQQEAPETGAILPVAGKIRILVVEDEPQVLQFVSTQLVSLGYEVTAVANGPDALELLEQDQDFALLFTDVVLPKGMNGVELTKRARTIRPRLKVLLTSGYSEEAFEHHGRPEEGTQLLRKPYRRKELADTLRKVLEG